jgi:anti-anti-sigma factor
MATVGQALQGSAAIREVVVNLSGLETVTSSFVAGLLVLRQLMETVGSTLILCELSPRVRAILQRLNLHSLFVVRG